MNSNSVKGFIQDNTLTWTMTTIGYVYYTWNLYVSLKPFCKLMIVCCDKESYTFFRREGIPCVLWNESGTSFNGLSFSSLLSSKSVASFGTEQFKVFNHMKLDLLKWIDSIWREAGFEKSLYLDGDIVCKRDPWSHINLEISTHSPEDSTSKCRSAAIEMKPLETSLVFQCDCDHTQEHIGTQCNAPCSGVIAHDHAKQSFQELYTFEKELWKTSLEQDQVYIQNRLKMLSMPYGTLPRSLYGNGKIQMSGLWKQQDWVLLHYNFRIGLSKKLGMKKDGNWLIPY